MNSASAGYFRLGLSGNSLRIIATDGGLIEKPREVAEVLIVPGERVDIVAGPFTEGETFSIESLPYNRMTMLIPRLKKFAVVAVGKQERSVAVLPEQLRKIEALAPQHAEPMRKITFSVDPSLKNIIDFTVNGGLHASDKPVNVGELQIWEVSNTRLMDHPFHLHGFFFQVIEVNGKAPEYLAVKDTINLAPRSKVKIAWIADNRPGKWMYHCHILEHHAAGMMAHFEVVDAVNGPGQSSLRHCQLKEHAA